MTIAYRLALNDVSGSLASARASWRIRTLLSACLLRFQPAGIDPCSFPELA